jgi:hypothetical protein
MIDSATEGADRGYDFIKAVRCYYVYKESRDRFAHFAAQVRWFSERADYVCVFFDPDKPGTTGEA